MLSLLLAEAVPVHKSTKKWCCLSEFWTFSKSLANSRCTSLAFIDPRRSMSLNYTVTMLKAMEGTCPQPQQEWLLSRMSSQTGITKGQTSLYPES